ncbi:unnamed protein product [Mytilus edulis]|uniref:Uncharacterized protein n=1 Tax=Mytilus edulis TaxID=6550 RepID=A0A8S3RJA8_MYTED|nr:unnamed protein product [Mytilus edulis]
MSNSHNKQALINKLCDKLKDNDVRCKNATDDADLLIALTAVDCALFSEVVVIGEDTDILVNLTGNEDETQESCSESSNDCCDSEIENCIKKCNLEYQTLLGALAAQHSENRKILKIAKSNSTLVSKEAECIHYIDEVTGIQSIDWTDDEPTAIQDINVDNTSTINTYCAIYNQTAQPEISL